MKKSSARTPEERAAQIAAAEIRRAATRESLKERLRRENAHEFAAMLEACGNKIGLTCAMCGNRKSALTRCKKRWCPSCAYYIAAERCAKYREAASRFKWPLFVTLTVRNTIDPEGLARLKKSWGKMRRRKLIADKVKSGIIGYEMTNKGNGWHPHLHALLDCRWLSLHVPEPNARDSAAEKERKCKAAAEELSTLWAEVTGQETASVKVRRGKEDALIEVLKYSVKGSDLLAMPAEERAAAMIEVMSGMRLMTTFGEIRKEMAAADAEEEDNDGGCQCENCGRTGTMIPDQIINHAYNRAHDNDKKLR